MGVLDKFLDIMKLSDEDDDYDNDDFFDDEYDDDYEDIVIDHSDDDDVLIEPNQGNNIDTIRLIKIRSLSALSDELDNINKTGVPAIIDFKYLQERKQHRLNNRNIPILQQQIQCNSNTSRKRNTIPN